MSAKKVLRVVCLSIQSTDAKMMGRTAERLSAEGYRIEVHCANSEETDRDILLYRQLEEATAKADFVFIRCMSDPARFNMFERYERVLRSLSAPVFMRSGNADVCLLYRDLFKGSDEDYALLSKYSAYRGENNDRGIFMWAYRLVVDSNIVLPEPQKQRTEGICHPDFPRDITFEEYVGHLKGRPTAGILVLGNNWIYDNLAHINALIRRLESIGMDVIPVFFSSTVGTAAEDLRTSGVVRRFFMNGDRSRVDVILSNSPFSLLMSSKNDNCMQTPDEQNFFHTLVNVPVIQIMTVTGHYQDYSELSSGKAAKELPMQVMWPEVDGQIIAVPVGYSDKSAKEVRITLPLDDRIDHIAGLAKSWAMMGRTPINERKIAILMYQSRPDSGRIGNAASLDVPESVFEMLKHMNELGYRLDHVPATSRELMDEIQANVTNDLDRMPSDEVIKRAVDTVDAGRYAKVLDRLPDFDRTAIVKDWGEPPGKISVEKGKMIIPGIINGNVFIGYQPLRAWADQIEKLYHDPTMSPTHQYLEYYSWLKNDFKANAVIHMGTHGTLEWLPGRSIGLSSTCWPDAVLDSLPNVYPYVIDDPGEGIQAKRRSEAVLIGHLNATMARADGYDQLSKVDALLQEYMKLGTGASKERRDTFLSQIFEEAKSASLFSDLGYEDREPSLEEFGKDLVRLHDYLTGVKDALIRDGLHVLGRIPREKHLDEAVYSLTRLRNGTVPSFRAAFAESLGYDLAGTISNPSEKAIDGRLNSEILDEIDSKLQSIIVGMHASDFDAVQSKKIVSKMCQMTDSLNEVIDYICKKVVPNLRRTTDEISNMMDALSGNYVLPGPSGAPTRGNADILPMGRNYYGIDPESIPNRASWTIGMKMADQMIERYKQEKGTFPREVGFIIWATDTMKTGGDDVAYILWLMGVRPVWARTGDRVIDLETVPLSELKRPRVDVSVRITGLFRDAFPNLIEMIDRAVEMAGNLNESDEENCLAANLRRDVIEGMANGVPEDEARKRASARVFGCPPGAYGAGVNHAIESGDWKTVKDLADIYVAWGSCAYGRNLNGVQMKDEFVKRFGKVSVTVKNMPDREIDLFDMDDVYSYLGGLNSFVRAYGDKDAITVMGDSSDPDRTQIRDTKEECKFVFRSKVLNPKFICGLKEHGYRGAAEMANLTEYVFGWDATSDVIEKWMYDGLADKFLFDQDTQDWMSDVNPDAMMSILNRLSEAIERGMWNADDETKKKLKDLYIKTEGRLEEVNDRYS